ncbi:MAG: hypothetical protein M0P69_20925 [Bacteroidales bacterium]|nr:hypothetical protein [Bacteroidales bacterium]
MSENKSNGKLFFGGVPTTAEVNLLHDRYDDAPVGTIITYEDVSDIIKTHKGDSRFWTVTDRWRKSSFKKNNVVITCIPNVGFKLATPDERIQEATSKVARGRKSIQFASVIASTTGTRGLSESNRRVRDHIASIPSRLRLAELTSPKALDA